MGLVIKESIKSTITTFTGAVLGLAAMALSIKVFTQEEYGFYQSVIKVSTILAYFFILGFDYSLMIIGQRYPDDSPKRGAFMRYTLLIPLLVSAICIIPYFLSKDLFLSSMSPDDKAYYEQYYHFFPLITVIYTFLYWIMAFLRSKNRSTTAYFLHEIVVRAGNIVAIVLFIAGLIDFRGFIISLCVSLLIPIGYAIHYSRQESGFYFHKKEPLSTQEKKHILEFSFFHMMVVVAGLAIFHIDSFLFQYITADGLVNVGIFSLSLYAINVIRMPMRVVGLNAIPTLTQHYDQGHHAKLKELYTRSSINLQLLGSLLCVLVIVNIRDIQWTLDQWKPGYHAFETIVPILIIGVWTELCLGLNLEMMGISRYYRYTFWISCVYLIVAVSLFILLGRYWDLTGAAWAFTLSLLFFSVIKSVFVYRKMALSPLNRDSIKILVMSCACLTFNFLPTILHPFFSIFVSSLIILFIFVIVSLKWKVGEDVEHLYYKIKRRFEK